MSKQYNNEGDDDVSSNVQHVCLSVDRANETIGVMFPQCVSHLDELGIHGTKLRPALVVHEAYIFYLKTLFVFTSSTFFVVKSLPISSLFYVCLYIDIS
jgi:hypothetical protein